MKEIPYLGKWILILIPISAFVGAAVALFIWTLKLATEYRIEHPWLLFLLPVIGVFIVWSYRATSKDAEKGNNLIMDEIHNPGGGVPGKMAPLVFAGTILTHLLAIFNEI